MYDAVTAAEKASLYPWRKPINNAQLQEPNAGE
jgi:hypothetical protein